MNKDTDLYRKFVQNLALNNQDKIFLNSDKEHALIVLTELFRKAQNEIRIFASKLCGSIGDNQEYIIALSEFIEREGKLYILLNEYDGECAKTSNLYKRLAYYQEQGKPIYIKSTEARPYRTEDTEKKEVHFTISDYKAYRIETNTEARTAECSFNSPAIAKATADFFDNLFTKASDIDIKKLFYAPHQ